MDAIYILINLFVYIYLQSDIKTHFLDITSTNRLIISKTSFSFLKNEDDVKNIYHSNSDFYSFFYFKENLHKSKMLQGVPINMGIQ